MRVVRWPVLERRKEGEILRKSAWVCCKVFMRRKLRWVDKDRYYSQVILSERVLHWEENKLLGLSARHDVTYRVIDGRRVELPW